MKIMRMPIISKYLERRKAEDFFSTKDLERRLSEIGVTTIDSVPEGFDLYNPATFNLNPDKSYHPYYIGSITKEGAEKMFLEKVEERGDNEIYGLKYESLSAGVWVLAISHKTEKPHKKPENNERKVIQLSSPHL